MGLGYEFVPEFVLIGGNGGGGGDGEFALGDESFGDGEAGAEDDPGDGLGAEAAAAKGGKKALETVEMRVVFPEKDLVAQKRLFGGTGDGQVKRVLIGHTETTGSYRGERSTGRRKARIRCRGGVPGSRLLLRPYRATFRP